MKNHLVRILGSTSPSRKHPSDDGKVGGKVTLPPIDATPEEIAQALFQRPPLKKPAPTLEDDRPEPDETSGA